MLKKLFSMVEALPPLTNEELSVSIEKTLALYRTTQATDPLHTYLRLHLYALLGAQRERVQKLSAMDAAALQALIEKTAELVANIPSQEAPHHYLRHHLYDLLSVQLRLAQAA